MNFNKGDHVKWDSEAGMDTGKIIRIHTRDFDYKGYTHHATKENPQYEIKSDKSDHIAAHYGSALKKMEDGGNIDDESGNFTFLGYRTINFKYKPSIHNFFINMLNYKDLSLRKKEFLLDCIKCVDDLIGIENKGERSGEYSSGQKKSAFYLMQLSQIRLCEAGFFYLMDFLFDPFKKIMGFDIPEEMPHSKIYDEKKVFEKGGNIKNGKVGGYLVGRRHKECNKDGDCGIEAVVSNTKRPIEVESGEIIITRNAVKDNKKHLFDGKEMTNRQILSSINTSGGGVSFEEGGKIENTPSVVDDNYLNRRRNERKEKMNRAIKLASDLAVLA